MVKAKFSDIAANKNLIFSPNFFKWNIELKENTWFLSERIAENFNIISGNAFKSSDYVDEGIPLLRIGDIKKDGSIDFDGMNKLPYEFEELYKNFLLKIDNIAIAMTGATIGKSALVKNLPQSTLLNQRVGLLQRKDKSVTNVSFIQYLLRNKLFQKQVYINSMGKSQPNISPFDILNLKLPKIDENIQNKLISIIEPIEKEICILQKQKKESLEIINEVFANELKFDFAYYKKLGENKYHTISFSDINTPLLRTTFVQNNKRSLYLKDFLKNDTFYLKDIIIKPIKRGKQPLYKKDGIKVIKTINIKNGEINFEQVEYVTNQFYKLNIEKAGIEKFDLLLSSTGMGRGKFALYTDDEPCFADSHISIIRFESKKINPQFLNYFCQSFVGTEQLQYIEMHIKGTPEIYETQLNYFQIPILNEIKQEKIVNKISKQINTQKEIEKHILNKQDKISKLIENVIREA